MKVFIKIVHTIAAKLPEYWGWEHETIQTIVRLQSAPSKKSDLEQRLRKIESDAFFTKFDIERSPLSMNTCMET